MRFAAALLLAASLVGCGSVETKETKPDPVTSLQPQDPPKSEEGTAPPIGQPRPPVAPSATDKRTESLLHDNPPH